jgi:RNA polymerase subunit RPABC4/transcription elongation factor Spt4
LSETSTAEATYTCRRCGAEYTESDACPVCGALQNGVPCDDDPSATAHSRCVICGRAVCGDEPDGRTAALCDQHRTVPVIEGFAQVYTNNNALAAQLLVENLRAEGLDATLFSQADRSFPMDLGEMSIARVLVPTFEYEQALELIQDYMDTEGEVTFACPSCGEVYEPGQETCGSCGASLVG